MLGMRTICYLSGCVSLALGLLLGPIRLFQVEMARCLANARATTGPELMNAVKLGKNGCP